MQRVLTIGYEGADLCDFVATLIHAGVDLLLDIREIPISRRRGFSKTRLSQTLEAAGIAYRHEKRLGSPGPIRRELRQSGDYKKFFRDFRQYLATQSELIEGLAKSTSNGSVALMCYEADARICHRTAVAEALEKRLQIAPVHLGVRRDASQRKASSPQSADLGESVSTA